MGMEDAADSRWLVYLAAMKGRTRNVKREQHVYPTKRDRMKLLND